MTVTFQNREANLLEAAEIADKKSRAASHRGFQLLGVFVIGCMFVPEVLKAPGNFLAWAMLALDGALLLLITRWPGWSNQRYAKNKAQNAPDCTVELTAQGVTVTEGGGSYAALFEDGAAAYEYKNVIALLLAQNRVLAIPKDQLEPPERDDLIALLRQGLGERFERVELSADRGPLAR